MFSRVVDSKSRAYVLARITLYPKKITFIDVVELSSFTDKLITDGQTDTVLSGRLLSTGHAMSLSSIPARKIMRCLTHVRKDGKIELKY